MFECQCLKLQKLKGARSSYGGSEVLIACEASLNSSCRRQSPRIPTQMTKTREGRRTLKSHIGQPLWKFVMWLKKIIQDQRIMKLSDSCEMYVSALEETKHSKPDYKAEKLKKKLKKSDTYGQTLPFCSLNSGWKFKLYIVSKTCHGSQPMTSFGSLMSCLLSWKAV